VDVLHLSGDRRRRVGVEGGRGGKNGTGEGGGVTKGPEAAYRENLE